MAQNKTAVTQQMRFAFGENWSRFLSCVDDARIEEAERSLRQALHVERLDGKTFLDVGSGSGLFSLAARRLGATVRSFDLDPRSVECTREIKRRFFPDDGNWIVEEGSILDRAYLASLGRYDVVYSWGVLHHTGAMWEAIGSVADLVADRGALYLSIYNDQGSWSGRWRRIKRIYNRLPRFLRPFYVVAIMAPRELYYMFSIDDILHLNFHKRIASYIGEWRSYKKRRGMSRWHDLVDWVGGYPFEVAKPEEVFRLFKSRRFVMEDFVTCGGGLGCNQFLFTKTGDAA